MFERVAVIWLSEKSPEHRAGSECVAVGRPAAGRVARRGRGERGQWGGGVAAHRGPRAVTGPSELGRSQKPWAEGEGDVAGGFVFRGASRVQVPWRASARRRCRARASVAPLAVTAPRARAPGPFGGEADSSRAGLGVVFVTAKVFTPRNWNCRLFTLWGRRFGKEVKNRV